MADDTKSTFAFPVGYHEFHKNQVFNFQLNRWHSLGYIRFEDARDAGRKIETFEDWKREMVKLAEDAVSDRRLINAAFYYRAAEFYTMPDDPDKEVLYDKFIGYFYRAFEHDGIERFEVPYQGTCLSGMKLPPAHDKKGTIVMHGGFDSFIEGFYSMMRYFSDHGYEVVAFEGPGQGAARRKYGLALDYRWELPAKAVLDYFNLDEVSWLGISMGGWFCFRAAAFEPRIKRVIALGIAFDYMKFPSLPLQWLSKLVLKSEALMEYAAKKKMENDYEHRWSINNSMYITMTDTATKSMDVITELNEKNLHSDMVTQDVLILTGKEDHFIPLKMHDMQVKALTNARSVTGMVFTREDQAQNHCMIGNIGLAVDVMVKWIEEKSQAGTSRAG
jgi:pimeloyl-ACP methyl ester carboxylesterase